ncbi:MAG: Lrp/AsnC family transcriptional regulator [Ignavibacteria bacterium]|nr:Lrp/AsnC family transcriptional regulator [Ignavibacteria bacterium]
MKPLDPINKKILDLLQENSSITNAELAQKIGLAPASTFERVKKLEKSGIIRKNVALVDGEKVGKGTVVFVIINMAEHSVKSIKELAAHIKQIPEVLECHRLAGERDYILKIVTHNIQTYESLAINKLAKIPGIARTNTYFALSTLKEQTKIPILDEPPIPPQEREVI